MAKNEPTIDAPELPQGPPHPLKVTFLGCLGVLALGFFFKEGVISITVALVGVLVIALLGYFLYAQYRYHQRRLYPSVKRPMGKNRFMTLALIIGEAVIVALAALFSLPVIPVALLGLALIALLIWLARSALN